MNFSDLSFMTASLGDATEIANINQEYIGMEDSGGFLVIPHSQDEILNLLQEGKVTFYIAKNLDGPLLGYVEVSDTMDISLLDQMDWLSSDMRKMTESILSKKYAYVKQLAIRRGFQRQGIASFLYRMLEEHLRIPVVAYAAIEPKRNEASIQFHLKHGFTKVATLYRENFGDLTEYQSYFFVKPV